MIKSKFLAELPYEPAVYALLAKGDNNGHVAYVGSSKQLSDKLNEQFGDEQVNLPFRKLISCGDPGRTLEIRWWLHPVFERQSALEAAEVIAFITLNPTVGSANSLSEEAEMLIIDEVFRTEMNDLFNSSPTGVRTFTYNDI